MVPALATAQVLLVAVGAAVERAAVLGATALIAAPASAPAAASLLSPTAGWLRSGGGDGGVAPGCPHGVGGCRHGGRRGELLAAQVLAHTLRQPVQKMA